MSGVSFGASHGGAVALSGLGFSDDEQGYLALARHFLTTFTDPASQAWAHAFTIAEERFGPQGGAIALGLQAVIAQLLKLRPLAFRFHDPLCPQARGFVTSEEHSLILLLRAMTRDVTAEARRHVVVLTGGRMDPVLIRMALALAKVLPRAGGPVRINAHAGLRLVH